MAIQCFDGRQRTCQIEQDTKPTRSAIWLSVTARLAPEVYEGLQLSLCDDEDKFG
jgi:hypothetical protein